MILYFILLYIIINYIIATFAFNPPLIPTYTLEDIDYIYNGIAIKIIRKTLSSKVILFNHNNADDIGICSNYCKWLSNFTNCTVIFYDYIGYGLSTKGALTEYNLLKSVDIVYFFITRVLNIDPNNLYIVGKSLGTVPATYLSKYKNNGLLLISPMLSGIRIYYDHNMPYLDNFCFPNNIRIRDVKSKIGIIHGTEDKLINVKHTYELLNIIENKYKPLIINAGHNNIETTNTNEFINYVKKFID
tara:strand:+ start:148 stop:882 length:735 start_codon:yes stop_codon:yes gene_type:complete